MNSNPLSPYVEVSRRVCEPAPPQLSPPSCSSTAQAVHSNTLPANKLSPCSSSKRSSAIPTSLHLIPPYCDSSDNRTLSMWDHWERPSIRSLVVCATAIPRSLMALVPGLTPNRGSVGARCPTAATLSYNSLPPSFTWCVFRGYARLRGHAYK